MDALQLFEYENHEVRVVQGEDGELFFVAKDVAEVLGYSNTADAVSRHCKAANTIAFHDGTSGNPNMTIIPERDVYRLIMRSKLPKAQEFEEWVVGTVLPSIRRHGGYLTPQKVEEALLNPDVIIRLATDLKAEREQRLALAAKVTADAGKVLFAEAVQASRTSILVGDLAKILRQNGVLVGQKRLFEWLREEGFLIRQRGESWNMPTQRAVEQGLFEVKERTINNPDGSIRITRTPKVTGKGQQYFVQRFLAPAGVTPIPAPGIAACRS